MERRPDASPSGPSEPWVARDFVGYFDPLLPVELSSANLPHWRQEGVTYFVTFRLADSLPVAWRDRWAEERRTWLAHHLPPVTDRDRAEYHALFTARIEHWLDQGVGSCVLEMPECHQTMAAALTVFDGVRYHLVDRVVAANHVHVLVTPLLDHTLSSILHSWKSFTAKELAKVEVASRRLRPFWLSLFSTTQGDTARAETPLLRRVWRKESFDHIVRNAESLERIQAYIRDHKEYVAYASPR